MADQCMMLEDRLYVADAVALRIGLLPLQDALVTGDGVSFGLAMTISDSLTIADATTVRATGLISDALHISASVDIAGSYRATIADRLVVRDRLLLTQIEQLSDELDISDSAVVRRSYLLGDTLRIADDASPVRRAQLVIGDRLRVSDRAVGRRSTVITETLKAGDGYATRRRAQFGDECVVQDAVIIGRSMSLTVTDHLRADDAASVVAHRTALAGDSLIAEDRAVLPTLGVAWTSNTDTWAASRYVGWEITSLVSIGDQLFGTGPGGLYALDGDDDDGADIAAVIRTDQRSGGPEASLRHGGYLYASMSAPGPMGARVLANPGATAATYTYDFEARRNDELGPMRLKYGRGIKSLMWQFEVFNKEGADFRIAGGLAWVTDPGSRRV